MARIRIRCFKKQIGSCLSRAGTTCSCKRHNAEKESTHKKLPNFHPFCRLRCNSSIWAATGPSWCRGGLQLSFCLQCYVHMLWKRMLRCRKTRTVIRRGNVVFPSPINSTKYVFLYSSWHSSSFVERSTLYVLSVVRLPFTSERPASKLGRRAARRRR